MLYLLHDNILAVPSSFSQGMSPLEFGAWMKGKHFLPEEDYRIIIGKMPSIYIHLFTIRYYMRVSNDSLLIHQMSSIFDRWLGFTINLELV